MSTLLDGAIFVTAQELDSALSDGHTRLLVLPYGSAFPEDAWSSLRTYLDHGGNLLVIGGRPFTRAAYKVDGAWKLRDYSVRFIRELMVDQFQETPGSAGLIYSPNPDIVTQLPPFSWQHSFSPILHLSSSRIGERAGSAGRIDARIDALAWGTSDGQRLSAPVLQIDHLRESFVGGRWIWIDADLPADFGSSATAKAMIDSLVAAAERGAEDFEVNPVYPLYLPGEPIQLKMQWMGGSESSNRLSVRVTITPEDVQARPLTQTANLANGQLITMPSPQTKGLHRIDAELLDGKTVLAKYHSGFWMRDEAYLRSGPKLGVNADYFEVNGKPLAVVGTTYMSSQVQRLYFDHPNVYVWDRDLGQIQDAGINMIRTGWWSGWDKLCDENGVPYERTLRTLEAFLMTARRHGLPVQFNVFAFIPDVLDGENAYLDPVAVQREEDLYSGLAGRFGDVPYLAWDLINEPSFGQHIWTALPNGDPIEAGQWNAWLKTRYPSRAALQNAWNLPTIAGDGSLPVPTAADWAQDQHGSGSLMLYDFYLFSQEKFTAWVAQIREAIRSTGSQQLITVGQDEGGNTGRLLPSYFSGSVDFTTNHSWYQSDGLLWDSMVAKQPGKTMLIQETGVGAGTNPDLIARRSLRDQAALLERKIALSFAQGSG
ncbi:MAG: cellulase family glycosylhydrolase, partial [Silvibacterium sp.]